MSIGYNAVLERLKEERKRWNWTQEEMSQKLCLTQGHYNKIENGFKRLSYTELHRLYVVGVDIYYIMTGKRNSGQFDKEILKDCSDLEVYALCQITYAVLRVIIQKNRKSCEVERRIINTNYVLSNKATGKSFWVLLRESNDLKQDQMARVLGINIKKYRNLEKGLFLPDSEIMFRVCDFFHISPFLILSENNFVTDEICSILCEVDYDIRDALFEYLKLGFKTFMI